MFVIHNPKPSANRLLWRQFLWPKNEVNKYNGEKVDFKGSNRHEIGDEEGLSIGITLDIYFPHISIYHITFCTELILPSRI